MAGRLNRPVAADGVVAYQDYEQQQLFHYFPLRVDAVLGETLTAFKVDYYGINEKPYWVDMGSGNYQSCVGGNLSGTAVPDITGAQRAKITKAIEDTYGIKKPNLVPLVLNGVTVQPIFAKHIVDLGTGGSSTFPTQLNVGSSVGYQVGSGNSLFATLVGNERDTDATSSPDFAVNIYGEAELYADPWVAEIHADLSRVWEYTRTKVGVGVNIGWFNIGVDIDKITQELITQGIVTIKYRQGGGGSEFGWQMLNTTKTLFEAINKQVASGEGLFKFEPNPTPQPPAKGDKWGGGLLPFTTSVNVSYNSEFFKQTITFDETVTFEGQMPVRFTTSMALAVPCGRDTESAFYDLQLTEQGCVSKEKTDGLQRRIGREQEAKRVKIESYLAKVESGQWTPAQFSAMVGVLNTITLTEYPAVAGVRDDGGLVVESATADEVDAVLARIEGGPRRRHDADRAPAPLRRAPPRQGLTGSPSARARTRPTAPPLITPRRPPCPSLPPPRPTRRPPTTASSGWACRSRPTRGSGSSRPRRPPGPRSGWCPRPCPAARSSRPPVSSSTAGTW